MKLFICTDMEGVSGVTNFKDYTRPDYKYYEMGRRLLTKEVNAAVEGFFQGGVTEISVLDGHGPGAINQELLDDRVNYIRGHRIPIFPCGLDDGYDALAFIGQHAKSNTPYSHLTHTGMPCVYDMLVNGVSIGEYGQLALCAMELGIPTIFAAGEKAFADEAEAFTPGVVTVWGKRGLLPDSASPDVSDEEYWDAKLSAEHIAPARVREMLTAGARLAAEKYFADKSQFHYLDLKGPWEIKRYIRKPKKDSPHVTSIEQLSCRTATHPTSYIAALNQMY